MDKPRPWCCGTTSELHVHECTGKVVYDERRHVPICDTCGKTIV
jgi:hypothetical protein